MMATETVKRIHWMALMPKADCPKCGESEPFRNGPTYRSTADAAYNHDGEHLQWYCRTCDYSVTTSIVDTSSIRAETVTLPPPDPRLMDTHLKP